MTSTPGDGDQPGSGQYGGQSGDPYASQQPGDPYASQQYGGQYGTQPYGQYGGQYGQSPYGQGYPQQDHPRATTALVLGIVGIVLCGLAAPFAWRIGKKTVDEIDASHGQLGGRGSAKAGYILGLIGTVLLALGLLAIVALVTLGLATEVTRSGVGSGSGLDG